MTPPDPRNVPLRVRLPFGSEAEFAERFGANVTRGGVFIPTRALKPEGTALRFELVLADGTRLLRGEAVVARAQVDTAGARTGMTLRFLRLDAASQAFLERLLGARELPPPAPAATEPESLGPVGLTGEPHATSASPAGLAPRLRVRSPVDATPTQLPTQLPTPLPTPLLTPLPTSLPTPPPAPGLPAAAGAQTPPPGTATPPGAGATGADGAQDRGARGPRGRDPGALARQPLTELLGPQAAARRAEAEAVLGVDLGTSYARAALFRQGTVEVLTPAGEETPGIPSLIALGEDGQPTTGEAARELLSRAPEQVATGVKRLLGRRERSARMLEHSLHSLHPVQADAHGHAALALGGRMVAASELTAHLLRGLAERAAERLGHPVRRAVLAVPAYFTDAQRAAMLEAGRLAGLEVLRLVNEASAAALAYGHGRALARKRLLVYDLGGGTFDATVVEVTGDDVEVVSTGGDNFLGGIDFDARVEYELRRVLSQAGLTPPPPASPEGQRLREAAEGAKRALSEHPDVEVVLDGLARDGEGMPAAFTTTLARTRLEELSADLVERTLEVTQEVLGAAAITPQGLDDVLLLGGQSRSPHVRRRLEEALGRPLRTDVGGADAVAHGAALLGHALVRAAQGKGAVALTEVLSTPVGIAERDAGFRRVLERNTRLPAQKTLVLPARAGEPLALVLFQGSAPHLDDNEYLGATILTPEREGEALVHLAMGADATLSLEVTLPGGKRSPVQLDVRAPDAGLRAQLLAAAPQGEGPPATPGGLLGGLRRLFGRR